MSFHSPSKDNFKQSMAKHLISSLPSILFLHHYEKNEEEKDSQSRHLFSLNISCWYFSTYAQTLILTYYQYYYYNWYFSSSSFLSFFRSFLFFSSLFSIITVVAYRCRFHSRRCLPKRRLYPTSHDAREEEKERKIWIYYREEMRLNEK